MKASTVRDLGAQVRSARQAQGLTQADLAERLNVSRDWVVRLEKGHPRLEAQRVLDALVVLGLTLDVSQPRSKAAAKNAPKMATRTVGRSAAAAVSRSAKTSSRTVSKSARSAKSGTWTSKKPAPSKKPAASKKDPFDVVFRGR